MKTISLTIRVASLLLFILLPVYFINAQGSIPTDRAMKAGVTSSSIPNFDYGNFYKSNYHSRGFQWALYSLKCPLAWEITKGQDGTFGQEIFIGAKEMLGNEVEHPDMRTNFTLISNQYGGNLQNIRKRSAGDTPNRLSYSTDFLRDDHGLLTLSCAIAGENNGDSAAMVGVAPKCFGFYTSNSMRYDSLDVDGKHDNKITTVDVTYQATNYNHDYDTLIHNGIVSFIATGNSIAQFYGGTIVPIFDQTTSQTVWYQYPVIYAGYHNNSFYDARYPNDASNSIRPITISGMVDGDIYDQWCNLWKTGPNGLWGPTYKGAERFSVANYPTHPNLNFCFTFSRGNEKFSNDMSKRNDAFVDLIVPAFSILSAAEETSNPSYQGRLYQDGSGTSQGSAMAAGVGALMRSVSKYLLAPIDNNRNSLNYRMPLYKQDVHKFAYDILTFTADKVADGGVMPTVINQRPVATKFAVWNPTYNRYEFGANYNYDYVTQQNDKLRRSWAIRMGFGKINAYRAVAHSIRNKGEYEYTLLPGSNSMENMFKYSDEHGDTRGYQVDGKRVLHFGSKVKEGNGTFYLPIKYGPTTGDDGIINVLEWGGVSLPGETHNNQGVTSLDSPGGRAGLVVPANCILAIDGVLFSVRLNNNFISATAPNSKILIEGLMIGIELFGNIKIGDLALLTLSSINFTGNSDLYGKLMNPHWGNNISLSGSGILTVHPGAGIHSNSDTINCTNSSIATFKSGSEIMGSKLNVSNNAKIIIDDSSTVNFDCELALNNNAELILKPGAVLHLKKLDAISPSKITMYGGSILFLDCDNSHLAGKIVAVNSSASNPIHILSKMADNCYAPTTPEFLNSYSSCYANLRYAQTGSNLGYNDIRNVNLSRYKSASEELESLYETSIISIEPNPTSADANVTYSIAESGTLSITLCNTLGQEVLEIHNGFQSTGMYTKSFSATGLAKGIYFIKMLIESEAKIQKIIVN